MTMATNVVTTDSHFQLLLQAARSQPEPQRLMFVFAKAALPADPTPDQQARFDAGEGGELEPVICVDKHPEEVKSFAALAAEADNNGADWQVVFAAGLSGRGQTAPTDAETAQALEVMVEAVRQGRFGRYAAYDTAGEPLGFS